MPNKPVWENRFEGLATAIETHKESNLQALGRMAIAYREGHNSFDYWKAVGKAELLDQLSSSASAWKRF